MAEASGAWKKVFSGRRLGGAQWYPSVEVEWPATVEGDVAQDPGKKKPRQ
jgi:hypothetical protein